MEAKSEFASLSDLALAKGIAHSDLISEIHQTILLSYRERYPDSPVGVAVYVDELTGNVRIFSGDRDITPENFAAEAAQMARQLIIAKLGEEVKKGPQPTRPVMVSSRQRGVPSILANLFFWGYNIYFLFFIGLMILSFVSSGWNQMGDYLRNLGAFRVLLFVIMAATPAGAVWWSIKKHLYRTPRPFYSYFFCLNCRYWEWHFYR